LTKMGMVALNWEISTICPKTPCEVLWFAMEVPLQIYVLYFSIKVPVRSNGSIIIYYSRDTKSWFSLA
jgi:hypothetical protein